MAELSAAKRKKYVEQGGVGCPYCASENVRSDPIENGADPASAMANAGCTDCGREWVDMYRLIGIEPADPEPQ